MFGINEIKYHITPSRLGKKKGICKYAPDIDVNINQRIEVDLECPSCGANNHQYLSRDIVENAKMKAITYKCKCGVDGKIYKGRLWPIELKKEQMDIILKAQDESDIVKKTS